MEAHSPEIAVEDAKKMLLRTLPRKSYITLHYVQETELMPF